MARSGHAEAIHHFSVALDLLTKLGRDRILQRRSWSCASSSGRRL
jgi:hypothetical protein